MISDIFVESIKLRSGIMRIDIEPTLKVVSTDYGEDFFTLHLGVVNFWWSKYKQWISTSLVHTSSRPSSSLEFLLSTGQTLEGTIRRMLSKKRS